MSYSSHSSCSIRDELHSIAQLLDILDTSCHSHDLRVYIQSILQTFVKPLLIQELNIPSNASIEHPTIASYLSRHLTSTQMNKLRTLSKKGHRQSGGKYFGEGSFGAVYGNPGLPCRDQPLPSTNDVVTKVFFRDGEAEREIQSIQALLDRLNPRAREAIELFCVLPISMEPCRLDCHAIRDNPDMYDPDSYGWKERSLCRGQNARSTIVKYPKATASLSNIFGSQYNELFFDYLGNLHQFTNILHGIHFFQRCKMMHGDIKPSNMVLIDRAYKFIDMADAKYMDIIQDIGHIPGAYQYFVYPPCSPWTDLCNFVDGEEDTYPTRENIPHTPQSLIHLYEYDPAFNREFILSKYLNMFEDPCDAPGMNSLNEEDQQHIRYQLLCLHAQKLYIRTEGRSSSDILRDINKYSKRLKDSDEPVWYGTMKYGPPSDFSNDIERHNTRVLQHFDTVGMVQAKYDLLLRIDTYGCGISLLLCTQAFLEQIKDAVTLKQAELIAKVFDFIYKCCDAHRYTTPNRSDLVKQWKAILDSYDVDDDSELEEMDENE